jgi:hypothetical protein
MTKEDKTIHKEYTMSNLFAQKDASIWYFGKRAGLDFRSVMPVPLHDGQLATDEGCATVNDQEGNLLFYTNGEKVWTGASFSDVT